MHNDRQLPPGQPEVATQKKVQSEADEQFIKEICNGITKRFLNNTNNNSLPDPQNVMECLIFEENRYVRMRILQWLLEEERYLKIGQGLTRLHIEAALGLITDETMDFTTQDSAGKTPYDYAIALGLDFHDDDITKCPYFKSIKSAMDESGTVIFATPNAKLMTKFMQAFKTFRVNLNARVPEGYTVGEIFILKEEFAFVNAAIKRCEKQVDSWQLDVDLNATLKDKIVVRTLAINMQFDLIERIIKVNPKVNLNTIVTDDLTLLEFLVCEGQYKLVKDLLANNPEQQINLNHVFNHKDYGPVQFAWFLIYIDEHQILDSILEQCSDKKINLNYSPDTEDFKNTTVAWLFAIHHKFHLLSKLLKYNPELIVDTEIYPANNEMLLGDSVGASLDNIVTPVNLSFLLNHNRQFAILKELQSRQPKKVQPEHVKKKSTNPNARSRERAEGGGSIPAEDKPLPAQQGEVIGNKKKEETKKIDNLNDNLDTFIEKHPIQYELIEVKNKKGETTSWVVKFSGNRATVEKLFSAINTYLKKDNRYIIKFDASGQSVTIEAKRTNLDSLFKKQDFTTTMEKAIELSLANKKTTPDATPPPSKKAAEPDTSTLRQHALQLEKLRPVWLNKLRASLFKEVSIEWNDQEKCFVVQIPNEITARLFHDQHTNVNTYLISDKDRNNVFTRIEHFFEKDLPGFATVKIANNELKLFPSENVNPDTLEKCLFTKLDSALSKALPAPVKMGNAQADSIERQPKAVTDDAAPAPDVNNNSLFAPPVQTKGKEPVENATLATAIQNLLQAMVQVQQTYLVNPDVQDQQFNFLRVHRENQNKCVMKFSYDGYRYIKGMDSYDLFNEIANKLRSHGIDLVVTPVQEKDKNVIYLNFTMLATNNSNNAQPSLQNQVEGVTQHFNTRPEEKIKLSGTKSELGLPITQHIPKDVEDEDEDKVNTPQPKRPDVKALVLNVSLLENLNTHINALKSIPKPEDAGDEPLYFFVYLVHALRMFRILGKEDNLCYEWRNAIRHLDYKLRLKEFYQAVQPLVEQMGDFLKSYNVGGTGLRFSFDTKRESYPINASILKQLEEALDPLRFSLRRNQSKKNKKKSKALAPTYQSMLERLSDPNVVLHKNKEIDAAWKEDAKLMLISLMRESENGQLVYGSIGHGEMTEPYAQFRTQILGTIADHSPTSGSPAL